MTPRHIRPVPGAGGEDEPDERELRADRDHRRRIRQLPEHDTDEHDTKRDRQRVAAPREQDERVLRAHSENIVDHSRSRDVGRADPVLRDRLRVADRDDRAERREIPLLVPPTREHDARPTARREQGIDADPDDEEEPVDLLDDPAGARSALQASQVLRCLHGGLVRRRDHLSAVDDLAVWLERRTGRRGAVPHWMPCAS